MESTFASWVQKMGIEVLAAQKGESVDDHSDIPRRPERPILTTDQDALGREGFVRRLVSAVINAESGKATGVVVGITGAWGSGKSSILNLMEERIRSHHRDAVVVRFDPWLISGRNDLISAFINELSEAIKATPVAAKRLKSITGTLTKYGEHLSPAANLYLPGAGAVAAGFFKIVSGFVRPEKSLTSLRAKLVGELQKAEVPIVVLIDEIDRVEDAEIRTVAQLVRAVADFPGISYVLAYDADRVAQALGAGARNGEEQDRGRGYLEKIVQLQIPLPLTFDYEVTRLVTEELGRFASELELPRNFASIERYQALLGIIAGNAVATPRDVSRLIGTYHAVASMLAREVDWIDLLAYSVLLIKAPGIVAAMRENPGVFLGEPLSQGEAERQFEQQRLTAIERLKLVLPESELVPKKRSIIEFLFPTLSEFSMTGSANFDSLSQRRPLLTTLRLGLLPGNYTKAQIRAFAASESEEIAASLKTAYDGQTIEQLIDRLDEMYPEMVDVDHLRLWKGVATFIRKPDCEWMSSYQPMHTIVRSLASVLEHAVRRDRTRFEPIAQKVFTSLRNVDENELTALWLRSHIFAYGLFGREARDHREVFLTEEQSKEIAIAMSSALRGVHLCGQLIPCRWDLQPVYTMLDTGAWDDLCRAKMDESLKDDRALDGLTLMLYGSYFSSDRSVVEKICSIDPYLAAVNRRLSAHGSDGPHETTIVALRKAASGGW